MIEVLFVDDDPGLLEDLRNMLIMAGARWDIYLANSGEEALRLCEQHAFDVVVSDMTMPGMDGRELLAHVRDNYPEAMRILMSGNLDVSFTSRLVPQAHQILHKPCQPNVVKTVVERACALGQRLTDPGLKSTLGTITDLPRPPRSIQKLNDLLSTSDADIADVVEVVEGDMALTVKLFQLVNSAYYGLSRNIQEISEAVAYLGMNTVRNLAVSVEVSRAITPTSDEHAEFVEQLHEHATRVASIARQLVLVREQANEAFVAGLLHDVGLLAVVSYMPERFGELQDASQRLSIPIWDLEVDVLGSNHADLGAYLLNLWGLPYGVVEAVARHHDAMQLSRRKMDATHAVCIADAIVSSQVRSGGIRESGEAGLDSGYLGELGVLERVAGLLSVRAES